MGVSVAVMLAIACHLIAAQFSLFMVCWQGLTSPYVNVGSVCMAPSMTLSAPALANASGIGNREGGKAAAQGLMNRVISGFGHTLHDCSSAEHRRASQTKLAGCSDTSCGRRVGQATSKFRGCYLPEAKLSSMITS